MLRDEWLCGRFRPRISCQEPVSYGVLKRASVLFPGFNGFWRRISNKGDTKHLRNVKTSIPRRPLAYQAMISECSRGRPFFLVLSGCQSQLLAQLMEVIALGNSSHHFIGSSQRISDFCNEGWRDYKDELDQADVIYTQKPRVYQFLLQMGRYRAKARFLPLMNCSAFHPDMTYMRHKGEKLVGPMGDYHSILVTAAYFSGLPQEDAIRLFRPDVYEAMGYFEKVRVEMESFHQRFHQSGIDVKDLTEAPKDPWMRTLNHPKPCMVAQVVSRVLERDGIEIKNRSPSISDWVDDNLAKGPEWPLYSGLFDNMFGGGRAEHDPPMIFKSPYKSDGKPLFFGIEKLVEYSYTSLQSVDMADVMMLNYDLDDALETLKNIETI